jgi:hypothetical protein
VSIIRQYDTEGHSPLQVLADDFTAYVLKFPNNSNDNSALIKEFICHYLLKTWSIPTPDIVGLTVLPEVLKECQFITSREKRLVGSCTCFGSKLLLNSIELMDFITAENKTSQKKILNSTDILKIGLFDIWTENEDRKPSNNNILLEHSKKGFILNPIDHAFTFSSVEFSELNYNNVNFSVNDSILYAPLAKSIIEKTKFDNAACSHIKEMFYLCIENAKNNYCKIADNVPVNLNFADNDEAFLSKFLFNKERNIAVLEEFFYIISTLKK